MDLLTEASTHTDDFDEELVGFLLHSVEVTGIDIFIRF